MDGSTTSWTKSSTITYAKEDAYPETWNLYGCESPDNSIVVSCSGGGVYTYTFKREGVTEYTYVATVTDVGLQSDGAGGFYPECWFKAVVVETDHTVSPAAVTTTTYYDNEPWMSGNVPTINRTAATNYTEAMSWSDFETNGVAALRDYLDDVIADDVNCAWTADSLCDPPVYDPETITGSMGSWEPSTYNSDYIFRHLTAVRYRFKIPSTHKGTYFKIAYDVVTFPEDTGVDPYFFLTDQFVEWTGPGDELDPDDESWFTDYFVVLPPAVRGENRLVNVRFICFTGGIPQYHESFEQWEPPV